MAERRQPLMSERFRAEERGMRAVRAVRTTRPHAARHRVVGHGQFVSRYLIRNFAGFHLNTVNTVFWYVIFTPGSPCSPAAQANTVVLLIANKALKLIHLYSGRRLTYNGCLETSGCKVSVK